MVTTRGEAENVEAGFESGCTDYVTKPIDAWSSSGQGQELPRRVREGAMNDGTAGAREPTSQRSARTTSRYAQELLAENEQAARSCPRTSPRLEREATAAAQDQRLGAGSTGAEPRLRLLGIEGRPACTSSRATAARSRTESRRFSERYVEVEQRELEPREPLRGQLPAARHGGTRRRSSRRIQEIVANLVGLARSMAIFELDPERRRLSLVGSLGIDQAALADDPVRRRA